MKPIITLSITIIAVIAIVGGVFAFVLARDTGSVRPIIDNSITTPSTSGDVQQVTLSIKNYNYYPQTITVRQGVSVRLILDSSVTGCYRTFVIPAFSVNSYSKDPTDTIIFTPTIKGTFKFQCSMGMGYGTLIVA